MSRSTKVLDFRIARLIEDSEDESRFQALTGTGQIVGTPHYIAPERISGQGYDEEADVYGLGVLFYECITGQLPFGGRNPSAVDPYLQNTSPKFHAPLAKSILRYRLAKTRLNYSTYVDERFNRAANGTERG